MTGYQDLLARLRAAKPDQPGWWMVERDDRDVRPLYLTAPGGAGAWTQDWREGFKFAERENAEQQIELWHSDYGHARSHGMMVEYLNPDGPEAARVIEALETVLASAIEAQRATTMKQAARRPAPSQELQIMDNAISKGRPVPVHASGAGVVTDCIMCGLPYSWHDQNSANWLACPGRERLTEIEQELEDQLVRLTLALARTKDQSHGG